MGGGLKPGKGTPHFRRWYKGTQKMGLQAYCRYRLGILELVVRAARRLASGEELPMVLLICKILTSWTLLSAIAAFTWSRLMAEGRCLHVNEIVVEVSPRSRPGLQAATSQLRAEPF